jgi:ketosteroid isomerase-like protein
VQDLNEKLIAELSAEFSESDDEQQIVRLFEDGDRALIAADPQKLDRIYATDYVQYDESGKIVTKQDLIHRLTSGEICFLSMISTRRRVRIFGDFAIVHGSEEDEVEQDGRRFSVRYVYMDVVVKREGRWQIVVSQLAKITS